MAVWSIVKKSELEGYHRLDAEYYQPKYLQAYDLVKNYRPLREHQKKILHPKEIKRIYADDDSRIIFLLAQNIKRGYLDFSTIAYISPETAAEIPQNRLEHGDVVLTRTGGNYGDAACYLGVPSPVYASAHCLVIRPKEVSGPLLSVYLNTQIGQMLIKRGVYGSSQPEIAPDYLKTIPIPRFGNEQERSIEELVRSRLVLDQKSDSLYLQAEQLLLDELGFKDLDLSHQLYYTVPFRKTKEADRLDAEHFQPKYEHLEKHLAEYRNGAKPLGSLIYPITNGYDYREFSSVGVPYLRVGDVRAGWLDLFSAERILPRFIKKDIALSPGDVLFTRKGTYGVASKVREGEEVSVISSEIMRLRLLPNSVILPDFLAVFLNTTPARMQVEKYVHGFSNYSITQAGIQRLLIPLLDKPYQERIAELVTQSWEARQKARQLLEEAKTKVENLIEGEAA